MTLRRIAPAVAYACSLLATAACADLDVTLQGRPAPVPATKSATAPQADKTVAPPQNANPAASPPLTEAVIRRAIANATGRAAPINRSALASRSGSLNWGIARRGAVPVLPPVNDHGPDVPETPEAPQAKSLPITARLGKVLASVSECYRLPDPRSQVVGKVKQNQQVALVSAWQAWYCLVMADGTQAYVPQVHVELLPYEVKTVTLAPTPPPTPAPARPPATLASAQSPYETPRSQFAAGVLQEAFRYVGVPYVWGGNDERGVDCSGLVKNCFTAVGVGLPRRASHQARIGQDVPFNELQPGDRLYFSVSKEFDHTGIYLGSGYFIHAGRGRGNVGVDHLSTPLYSRSLSAARR